MKLIANTLRSIAMAYCHYMVMRMQFRARLLARSVESRQGLKAPCEHCSAGSCC